MALPVFTVPAHYSADIGYRSISRIKGYFESTVLLLSGELQSALVIKGIFDQIKLMRDKLRQPYDAGLLDGDATWKQIAIDTWIELNNLATASKTIEEYYTSQAALAVDAAAQAGSIISLEDAAAGITVSQAHTTAIINALNTSLGN